jgi:aspartate racemase
MTILGMVGGIAPESTILYYRMLVDGYRRRVPDAYPEILINSINLTRLLGLVGAGDRPGLIAYLGTEIQRLADAGAGLAFMASNTPHLVYDEVQARSPIPMVSIVEATADRAGSLGYTRLGLLGTRFTMEGSSYPSVMARRGITVQTPNPTDRDYVHRVYLGELALGIFRPETKAGLLAVIERLHGAGVHAVILGGTELPLLLDAGLPSPVPLLDTTRLHVEAVLKELQVEDGP